MAATSQMVVGIKPIDTDGYRQSLFRLTMTKSKNNLQLAGGLLVVLLAITVALASERKTYSGFAVYRCSPQTEEQIDGLRDLQTSQKRGDIEFWKDPSLLNETADIMVSPDAEETLRTKLRVSRVPYKKIMHDVEEVIRRTSSPKHAHHRNGKNLTRQEDLLDSSVFHSRFNTFPVIEAKLKALAESDSRVKLEEVGQSFERRPLYLVKVSTKPDANKPVIFIDAGHHAREWASHATALYILESLLDRKVPTRSFTEESLATDESSSAYRPEFLEQLTPKQALAQNVSSLSALLEKYDFWMMPVINPDGYEHSHKFDRMWRKTRSRNSAGGSCIGVDPNRNYPYKWQRGYFCNEVFPGSKALSEPETEALANVLLRSNRNISMYISLHAYAAMMLSPYGFSRATPDNYEDLRRVAYAGMRAVYSYRRTEYKFGTAAQILYEAAGGSDDFAYGEGNIKLSYTIELPERGWAGFLLPPEEIIPTGQETVLGIAAMVGAI